MTKYICECDKGKTHRCTHESDGRAPVVCCVHGDESCNWRAVEDQKPKLETENKRLRKALKEIAEFANDEYGKRIPAPSCVEFLTIKRYAEKALKGVEEWV